MSLIPNFLMASSFGVLGAIPRLAIDCGGQVPGESAVSHLLRPVLIIPKHQFYCRVLCSVFEVNLNKRTSLIGRGGQRGCRRRSKSSSFVTNMKRRSLPEATQSSSD